VLRDTLRAMTDAAALRRRRTYHGPLTDDGRQAAAEADAVAAFLMARKAFLAGKRVEMKTLAADLDVDRTTLFRWVGNRDQLLGDVLCSLAEPTFESALASMKSPGALGVAEVMGAFVQALIDSPSLKAFLRAEPERALRVLTTRASPLQRDVVGHTERLLKQEQDRGTLTHPLAIHDLAYLIIRIAESFIYTDLITGERPDARKAQTAVAALLGVHLPVEDEPAAQPAARRRRAKTKA
jgi:hypothetical protein